MGIGLTNACNLSCAHCYRPGGEIRHLAREDVARVLDAFNVGSVNLGTGENILNPALRPVLALLAERGVPTSLTSNGLSLNTLPDELLRDLHDVEVSLDFADPAALDDFRGEGVFDGAVAAIRRCVALGLDVTVLAVMMRTNYDRLAEVARLAASLGARFRVNVYQPVHERTLMPTWEQFWSGFEQLFAQTSLVTCTEPVVAALIARVNGYVSPCGCGHSSVRLTPAGDLLPCVYWPRAAAHLSEVGPGEGAAIVSGDEFASARQIPATCTDCRLVSRCGGGCPSRRALTVGLAERDPYCPLAGPREVNLRPSLGTHANLLHAANVCTTITEAR